MKQARSITLTVGQRSLNLSAVLDGAFRLHAAPASHPPPADGTYLDPKRRRPRVRAGRKRLVTSAASLRVSGKGGRVALLDADGELLLTARTHGTFIELRSRKAGVCYGGADSRPGRGKSVTMTKHCTVKTGVGNGISVVPFLWHTSGWAVLALAEDDPASIRPADDKGRVFRVANTRKVTDLVIMAGRTMDEALRRLAELTGPAPVPPLWAMGFMHCRWGYASMAEIRSAWHGFRDRRHPIDAFIYDFEWYTHRPDYKLTPSGRSDYSDFGWNPRIFSDPIEDLAEARALGIRTIGIRKPRLGNRALLQKLAERGWRLTSWSMGQGKRTAHSSRMASRTLDFRIEDVRTWYWKRNRRFMEDGMVGWWNDEGEQFPTLYYWWNRAQVDGQAADFPNTRFWSINRAYSAGLARLGAAVWTGDSKTGWNDLRIEVFKILNYGIAGMPWAACDLGGFDGNPGRELMTRYMQMGVFFPIMRTHSCLNDIVRLPWNFGAKAEDAIRKALEWRYRLLPYTYSLAHETAATGKPIARPMALEFPGKPFRDEWEQWMFGPAILAAPVLDRGGRRRVRLPRGCDWYGIETGTRVRGGRALEMKCQLSDMPAWQRGGSILALAPVLQHTGELRGQPIEIRVAAGGNAEFTLFEDDGVSLDHQLGKKLTTRWKWTDRTRTLRSEAVGSFAGMPKQRCWTIRVLGCGPVGAVRLNGKPVAQARRLPAARRRAWYPASDGSLVVTTGRLAATGKLVLEIRS